MCVFVCACKQACHSVRVTVRGYLQNLVLSFHQMGSRDQTQTVRFGSKHCYLPSTHFGLIIVFLSLKEEEATRALSATHDSIQQKDNLLYSRKQACTSVFTFVFQNV